MIDLDELERLSRAATPGPWRMQCYSGGYEIVTAAYDVASGSIGDKGPFRSIHDASLVAACNPTTILELLRIARQHRAVLDAMRAYLPPNGYGLTTAALVSRLVEIMDPGGKPPEG